MDINGNLVGVTQARFEPLHKGHVFMVRMAYGLLKAEAVRQGKSFSFHIIVCSHDGEILPGHERFAWAKQTFGGYGNLTVHHAHNALEHVPGYGTDYHGVGYTEDWGFWGKVATDMCRLGDTVDYFYGSEGYVEPIAHACNAEPVVIDKKRDTLTVSGTMTRTDPSNHWDWYPDAVKPFFAKRVCIIGAPYTGKKELATALSHHYQTPLVADVSDLVYDPEERGSTPEDLEQIAQLHTVRAEALLQQANKVIVSDSDTLLTRLWYETVFHNSPPEWMREWANQKRFDLYVLTESNDHPFRPSNSFPIESMWHHFTEVIRNGLRERGWPYVSVSGPLDRRMSKAVPAIGNMNWFAEAAGSVGWRPGTQSNLGYENV